MDTRTAKLEGGVYTGQVRDGAGVTAPVIRDSQASNTPGVSENRAGVTTYLHSGLKDATAQSSVGQVVTASRVYDAFGMVVSSTGTWKGPFGYSGEHGYQEDATGLQLLGHRYYDPSTGRFLTRDPIGDGANWYVYCENAPLESEDATGYQLRQVLAPPESGVRLPGGGQAGNPTAPTPPVPLPPWWIRFNFFLFLLTAATETSRNDTFHDDRCRCGSTLDRYRLATGKGRVDVNNGKGGRDKGRGDDPLYDYPNSDEGNSVLEGIMKNPNTSAADRAKIRKILKQRGKINKKSRK